MRAPLLSFFILFGSAALLSQQSTPPASSSTQAIYTAQANSCQRKFDRIRQNGSKASPDQTPTVITENEINAWLTSGNAQLPQGVKKLQFRGQPGVIDATAYVDFDQVTAGRRSSNPLLSLFSGIHEVQATAHASGSGGTGQVHIDSVSLDGVNVPRMALEYFVERYITPKHPDIGLDSQFKLPYRIDTATVGSRQLTVTQK
jgi:hypothetical protein